MSNFDPSRQMYPHWVCCTLPCTCPPLNLPPLQVELFQCKQATCNWVGYTVNQLQEHKLDKHAATLLPLIQPLNGVYHVSGPAPAL